MGIKDQIAGNAGNIGEDFSRHMAMSICLYQDPQARGCKQGIKKEPCLGC